jgi:rhodanese-related sulfurtransferase
MLEDGKEVALLDVREEGVFFGGHLLFARSVPLSRLELAVADLVPRRATRMVICDGGEGLAERAAARLEGFGYSDVAVLAGGVGAWEQAGYVLFSGLNVPSKAFGEFVEHDSGTPSISAEELQAKFDAGEDLVVLDSRPMVEFNNMNIPNASDCPGAELAYRVQELAPSPDTLVVVNCAGRTRSIIGAQSLINAGLSNQVVALRNGTMGWHLAGFQLEHGNERPPPAVSADGLAIAQARAADVARRFEVKSIDAATLDRWRGESDRTLYLLDVRSPEEYEAGHMPGSISAPGGQLVQATDRYAGTLGARLVLVDDTGVRATMTASWLNQMGWTEVAVLEGGLIGPLESGAPPRNVLGFDGLSVETIAADDLKAILDGGEAIVIDLAVSSGYRKGHIPGAWFAVRARLADGLSKVPGGGTLVFTSEDGVLSDGWENTVDEADDVVLKAYDRDQGIEEAMREYLTWEVDLVNQIENDGTTRFRSYLG